MEKQELLKKVLSDYCAQNEELRFQESMLASFCEYAADWFKRNGVIGMGHTDEGLAIRMADGAEYSLFAGEINSSGSTSVSVTGTASKIEKGGDTTRSFPITGR